MARQDPDADIQRDGRQETANERSDRNWNEIVQELRVTQTGTQILTGFLLTVAFQARFAMLDPFQKGTYLVLVGLAVAATALGLAPVSLHRALFRRRAKGEAVRMADRFLRATLTAVAILVVGVVLFIVDVVVGRTAGVVAGAATVVAIASVWLLVPLRARR
ncbi:MAG TPA: DUF6328 family protein [Lacisediminihabitans sp.]|uniref:DUF6328 family protein n=1 Tax=Lacisediminihabitans sp. TaxID=2787631 RepID=UPI002ED7C2AC